MWIEAEHISAGDPATLDSLQTAVNLPRPGSLGPGARTVRALEEVTAHKWNLGGHWRGGGHIWRFISLWIHKWHMCRREHREGSWKASERHLKGFWNASERLISLKRQTRDIWEACISWGEHLRGISRWGDMIREAHRRSTSHRVHIWEASERLLGSFWEACMRGVDVTAELQCLMWFFVWRFSVRFVCDIWLWLCHFDLERYEAMSEAQVSLTDHVCPQITCHCT